MLEHGRRIEAAMERDQPAFTACHNDLLSENFILDADGKMWIIDWEYGGMTDPYFDLGDFVHGAPVSASTRSSSCITAYCGGMDERRFGAHDAATRCVAGLWWSVWAMIQHTVSQDRLRLHGVGHGAHRRARERVVDDPDYQKWLAAQ